MSLPRYQDFIDELSAGEVHGVFIDDTGSPGSAAGGDLHPNRKSWVAVVIPSSQAPRVIRELPRTISKLNELVPGASEFHFCDIYAGKGVFAQVDLQARLGIFRFVAWIFGEYKFPVLVQTLDPDSAKAFRAQLVGDRVGPLRFSKHDDLALFGLLVRVKLFLEGGAIPKGRARVFVDEGRFSNGKTIVIPPLNDVFCDGYISFADSRSVWPLQLADFAAFAMNRMQWLLNKSELSSLDKELLSVLTPVAECFVNGDRVIVDDIGRLTTLRQTLH